MPRGSGVVSTDRFARYLERLSATRVEDYLGEESHFAHVDASVATGYSVVLRESKQIETPWFGVRQCGNSVDNDVENFCGANDLRPALPTRHPASRVVAQTLPTYASSFDRHRHDLVRTRFRPGQSLLVVRIEDERVLQHVAQEVQLAPQAAIQRRQGRRDLLLSASPSHAPGHCSGSRLIR